MAKMILALITCFFVVSFTKSNDAAKQKINWLTIEQANAKLQVESKPVIIDLYTNWCYWCKVMDKKTYNNSKVISYINENFYAVKLNAETKDTVRWANKNFIYNSHNKVNDFALYATRGQLAFPNTIIFGDLNQEPASIPGFMEPKEIEVILKYFGDDAYKKKKFNEYSKSFKSTWR